MDKKFVIFLAVIIAAFTGFVIFNGKGKLDSSTNTKGSSNVYGKADSPVTLTEFVDFQCEACYSYYPYVKQLKEKYKGSVRFEIKYFPITSSHQFSFQAARSAEAAARQGKFFEMHDLLFQNQKTWEQAKDPQPYFDSYAKQIDLDMKKFQSDRMGNSVNDVINKDLADVKALGGDGTPTFALNGKKIQSPKPTLEDLSKVVDDALKNAGIASTATTPTPSTQSAPSSDASELSPSETDAQHDAEKPNVQP